MGHILYVEYIGVIESDSTVEPETLVGYANGLTVNCDVNFKSIYSISGSGETSSTNTIEYLPSYIVSKKRANPNAPIYILIEEDDVIVYSTN